MVTVEVINPEKRIPRDATTNSGRHIPAINEYLRTHASFHKGLEFIHIKDLAVYLVGHRIVWNQEVKDYLDRLGFEVRIITISEYHDTPMRVLARIDVENRPSMVKPFTHYPNYVQDDEVLYQRLLNNLKYDGILYRTTLNEHMFIRKDVSNYLKYYKCPVILRESFIKMLCENANKQRGVNRVLTNHYNPVWYYVLGGSEA